MFCDMGLFFVFIATTFVFAQNHERNIDTSAIFQNINAKCYFF